MIRKKILVVEDNEDNRHILVYRLRKVGDFDITEAQDGQEALALIAQDPPDLLFLDLKLPILDGWETARRIRAMQGPVKNLPIIALTAQAMVGDEEKAIAAYTKCLQLSPRFARARANLGIIHVLRKNKAAAMDQYTTLLTIDPALAAKLKAEIDKL